MSATTINHINAAFRLKKTLERIERASRVVLKGNKIVVQGSGWHVVFNVIDVTLHTPGELRILQPCQVPLVLKQLEEKCLSATS